MSFPTRPIKAPSDVLESISRVGSLARCLELAMTDLVKEDEVNLSQDDNDDDHDLYMKPFIFDNTMKEILIKRYLESIHEISWDIEDSTTIPTSSTLHNNTSTIKTKVPSPPPPAGLLYGKLQYYNRIGGNWRIVLSDAEIRPRVECEDTERIKNRTSLWDQSVNQMSSSSSLSMDSEDVIKLGHVVILACDDL